MACSVSIAKAIPEDFLAELCQNCAVGVLNPGQEVRCATPLLLG